MPPKTKQDEAPESVDQAAGDDQAASVEREAGAGDLVELVDGAYAIVIGVDPVMVLRLGVPQQHEQPLRLVG